MMIMGMYVYIEHLDPGQGRYWFNAEAIKLAELGRTERSYRISPRPGSVGGCSGRMVGDQ
jgi:hypothetical protein